MQESGRWFRTGICLCRTGNRWCRKVVAGAGLVAASAGKWLWCKKVAASAISKGIRLDFLNSVRLRGC